ncbi:GGDEF domain-containing protein [Achromobacter anxifer]|uniref:GGDEF domain-containing protein n=1 Tax=Achromobacter anxifer TaxID=1287737 RepID=UPI0020C66DF5|nr:sensor domain-containing diguanylate cyclase [Achromobacter anxifer]
MQTGLDGPLDRLARLARRHFGVDMALVACSDADGVWQAQAGALPACGAESGSLPFSVDCPLRAADGRQLGTFRLLHGQARDFGDDERDALRDFAELAAAAMEKRQALAAERAAEDGWRVEARNLSMAIAGSGTGIWDRNVVTGEITYSPGWKALLGFSEAEVSNRIEDSYKRLHPEDADYVRAAMQAHFDGKTESYEVEHRILCKDGSYKWICSRGKVVSRDAQGRALRMMGTTTDISAMRAMSERLRRTADLLVNLTDAVPGMVFQCGQRPEGGSRFLYVSAGIWDMFELMPYDVHTTPAAIEQRVHPEDVANYHASLRAAAAACVPWHLEFRVCLPEQGVRWRQGDASPRQGPDGTVVWHGFVTDITDRKRADFELRELAATDALTTLPNRRHFMSRIAAELARIKRQGSDCAAVLMCDLDHFKRINDTWGHAIGDGVLQHFANTLRAQLRAVDLVGRIGGEEFAVVLPDTDIERAHAFATRVQQRIAAAPYTLGDDRHIPLTVSIGISTMHTLDADAELALSRSDRALYYAKQRGRNRIESAPSVFSR